MMQRTPEANNVLVESLGSSLRRGGSSLESVPGLLKQVLREESWREFVTRRDELVRHERFVDFVSAEPLRGLGASVGLIKRIVSDDAEANDLLDQALKNPTGRPHIDDNVHKRPSGNSSSSALRRLRKDAPELHTEVLEGRLTAHAAMLQAGFRKPTFSVRGDDPEKIAETLRRKLSDDQIADLIRYLSS